VADQCASLISGPDGRVCAMPLTTALITFIPTKLARLAP
jgi:hypothetical protein